MKHFSIIALKVFFLAILSAVFIVFFTLIVLAWKKPDIVITMISRMSPSPTPIPLSIKGIAILGDSQSDEYRADDNRGDNYPSTTLNWIELLQKNRNLNFGK